MWKTTTNYCSFLLPCFSPNKKKSTPLHRDADSRSFFKYEVQTLIGLLRIANYWFVYQIAILYIGTYLVKSISDFDESLWRR